MAQDFATFNRKVDGVIKEFDGTNGKKRLTRVAMDTKKDVDEAVANEIGGDQAMRGWTRKKPIKIAGRFDLMSDHAFEVKPSKRGAGPMRVLEEGRNASGGAGGFQGPGVNRKTGGRNFTKSGKVAKQRSSKGKRWNGRTSGKGTWSDAVKLMSERVPRRVEKEVSAALRRHLGKG